MKKVSLVVLLLIFISFTAVTVPERVSATTLYVGGAGSGNYTSIQMAIDDANSGDTIFIYAGTYVETISVGKTLTITGEEKDITVIDGHETPTAVGVSASWVNITGLTITNSSDLYQAGLHLEYAHNCHIDDTNVSGNFDGIVLDHSDFSLISNNILVQNGRRGLAVLYSDNNTIIGNNISDNWDPGIELIKSGNNTIISNIISRNSQVNVHIHSSVNTTLSGNSMVDYGIFLTGKSLEYWNTHVIDDTNAINGKPVHYWKDVIGGTVPLGAGQVILANCSRVKVENQNMSNGSYGILIGFSLNSTISGNNVSSNGWYGIRFEYSSGNAIMNNSLHSIRGYAIYAERSHNNTIASNNISNNWGGVDLWLATGNVVKNNSISENGDGASLFNSNNNSVYHNDFIDNEEQASDSFGVNIWDSGYPSGGNVWSDYIGVDDCSGLYQDICPDPDGIGDAPYVIDDDSQDQYPLLGPGFEPNHPPVASFTISPSSGNRSVVFTMNASASHDQEDPASELEFKWNFYDRGDWDAFTMVAQHQYTYPGNYTIRLEVMDRGGLNDTVTQQLIVTPLESEILSCSIVDPLPGATVSGNYTIVGIANDPDANMTGVEIRIDIGTWMDAIGTTSWSYEWNTTSVPDGEHTIHARAYNATGISDVVTVTVMVDNTPPPGGKSILGEAWLWVAVGAIAVFLSTALILDWRGRKIQQPPT